jgi:hypothetical protein
MMLVFGLIIFFGTDQPVMAGEEEIKPYVDMDGDGFNDNAPDEDGDGIPDAADPDFIPVETEETNMVGLIKFGEVLKKAGLIEDYSTNLQKFGQLNFCTRALSKNRCGFDAGDDFGSEGIGIGGGSSGGCAGGVCR